MAAARRQRRSSRRFIISSAAPPRCSARRSIACAGKDFGELRHYDGVSPAWPIGYDELEPYYTEAEQLYQVHGERGADPTEPPASAPYPAPPVSNEPRIQKLHDDLLAAGYHPFPAPSAVMLERSGHGL